MNKPLNQEGLKTLLTLLKGETDKGVVDFNILGDISRSRQLYRFFFTKADGTITEKTIVLSATDKESPGLLSVEDKAKLDKISVNDSGVISADNLPSYVDDVIEGYLSDHQFHTGEEITEEEYKAATDRDNYKQYVDEDSNNYYVHFTSVITGETGKIYVDLHTGEIYRFAKGKYVPISDVPKEVLGRLSNVEDKLDSIKTDNGVIQESSLPPAMTNEEIDAICKS